MGIRWHDRVFVAGTTGTGKSEFLNLFFSRIRNQKVLLDTKPEFTIPGVAPVSRPEDIDWDEPIIHYRDLANDLEAYDQIFYELHHRRNCTVACHEVADLCNDEPSRTPEWVRKHLRKGNVFGNGNYMATQRPVGMPRQCRTEAQHIVYVVPALDPEDHKILASMMKVSIQEMHALLEEAAQLAPDPEEPRFSAVWHDRRAGSTVIVPPLPDAVRSQIIVRRAVDLDKRVTVHDSHEEE